MEERKRKSRGAFALVLVLAAGSVGIACWQLFKVYRSGGLTERAERKAESEAAIAAGRTKAGALLEGSGMRVGDPVFIRIFKESSELEIWMKPQGGGSFVLAKTYPIKRWSGKLGPKLGEGDRQAPEGFYYTDRRSLNPFSSFHLAFNINYPNAADRAKGYTGSFIMVHGGGSSIGCFAMTDELIEEIYAITEAAIDGGQDEVPIHVFPFRMTEERIGKIAPDERWRGFWITELLPEYRRFEEEASL